MKVNNMTKAVATLFFLGLTLQILAFLGSSTENIEIVRTILLKRYENASIGLSNLAKSQDVLIPGSRGFEELSELLKQESAKKYPGKASEIREMSVVEIRRLDGGMGFGASGANPYNPISFKLSTGELIEVDLSILKEWVNALRSNRVFYFSAFIFSLGVACQILAFTIEVRDTQEKTATTETVQTSVEPGETDSDK